MHTPTVFRAAIAALALAAASPASGADKIAGFTSAKVDLPAGDRFFPEGPHSDTVNNNCLACHSAGMVLNQPAMSHAAWQAEVEKMRAVYKAPIAEEDVKPIADYLAETKGAK